jgi:hypothetical protein
MVFACHVHPGFASVYEELPRIHAMKVPVKGVTRDIENMPAEDCSINTSDYSSCLQTTASCSPARTVTCLSMLGSCADLREVRLSEPLRLLILPNDSPMWALSTPAVPVMGSSLCDAQRARVHMKMTLSHLGGRFKFP